MEVLLPFQNPERADCPPGVRKPGDASKPNGEGVMRHNGKKGGKASTGRQGQGQSRMASKTRGEAGVCEMIKLTLAGQ